MKAKTIAILAVTAAGLTAGGYFGIRQIAGSVKKPVRVVPVSSVNASYYEDEEGRTISGNIISRDMQSVDLDTEYPLMKVYVKAGDQVKIGDPLLEYDMTMPVLQQEMHDLTRQTLELQLQAQQKALEKIMRNPGAAAVSAALDAESDDERTNSAQIEEWEDAADLAYADDTGVDDLGLPDLADPADPAVSDDELIDGQDGDMGDGTSDMLVDDGAGEEDFMADDLLIDDEPYDSLIAGEDGFSGGGDESLVIDPFGEDGLPYPETMETELYVPTEADETQQAMERLLRELMYNRLEQLSYYAGAIDQYEFQNNDISGLSPDNISKVLDIFENFLTDPGSEITGTMAVISPDAFGNTRREPVYRLKQDVLDYLRELPYLDVIEPGDESKAPKANELKDLDANDVYIMYAKVKFADLVYKMGQLEQKLAQLQQTEADADSGTAKNLQAEIIKAADAYYSFIENWNDITNRLNANGIDPRTISFADGFFTDIIAQKLVSCAGISDPQAVIDGTFEVRDLRYALSDETGGILSILINRLNDSEVVQEPEAPPETEPPLEMESSPEEEDYDYEEDDAAEDADETLSKEELEELLRSQRSGIKETQLQIRENAIKLKQDERLLSQRIIYATMNGVVKSAGTVEDGGSEDGFIEIAGASGMYVEGTVNELTRDSLKIGDVVSGMSWENYATFTAKVTEISVYPTTGQDDFFGTYGENSNASYYPFVAYIEDSDGIVEGMADMKFVRPEKTGGLYLDQYMIRTDSDGRNYVCIDDGHGKLKKQIVKTGKRYYGVVQIQGGLSQDDLIAFPYGKNVVEGAPTLLSDELDGMEYGMY